MNLIIIIIIRIINVYLKENEEKMKRKENEKKIPL